MVGTQVRVASELEEMVKELADRLGYLPFAVRNTAILYGLMVIANLRKIPKDDSEFRELLDKVRRAVDSV